jgi:serine/threonine-protein kinase
VKDSHYRLLGLVGEGQFGKVYTGIHRQTGELVALKELNPQQFSTKKFLREIRILLTLEHPHIVRCLGIEHNFKGRYLITEYCECGSLRDLLNSSTQLNTKQKLKLIVDILSGLAQVHQARIIHRDLKPENILLSINPQGWTAKISDFGVAKTEQEDKQGNNFSLGDTGSPAYMAPEQFYGKYSTSSDLYAVGIILSELLTGNRPFSGSPQEIMLGHLNQPPPIPDSLPSSLQAILRQALQKLPQHRFRTAEQMRQTLLNTLATWDSDQNFLSPSNSSPKIVLNLIEEVTLTTKIKLISASEQQVLFADNFQINLANYDLPAHSPKAHLIFGHNFSFTNPIVGLENINKNAIAITQEQNNPNHYQFWLINQKLKSLIQLESGQLVYAIAPNQKWLAVVKKENSAKIGFQMINLSKLMPINYLIEDFIPNQLLALDNHHGLAIYHQPDVHKEETFFRFFTRRGTWTNNYSLSIPLSQLTLNKYNQNYLLAKENLSNNVILIKIKPWQVNRINLQFNPDFIVSLSKYFLCGNQAGEISCVDLEGNNLGYHKLNLNIDAMTNLTNNSIILATGTEQKSTLQIYQIADADKI